jgi:hypothetical protein
MKLAYLLLFSLFIISCYIENKEIDTSNPNNIDSTFISNSITEKEIIESIDKELAKDSTLPVIHYSGDKQEAKKGKVVEAAKVETKEALETKPIVTEPIKEKTPEPVVQIRAEIHKTWDNLLKKHVSSSGKVNYEGFVKDKDELLKYIKELQSFHKDVSSWGKNKRLAYWINVYNVVTVKLITDNYPLKSIQDLNGGKAWDLKLIDLGGVSYTLNVIENKIIRPKYNESRIHFAVNCAAKSCPKIMNRAWTEDNIQRYLAKQTRAFVANTKENSISANKIELSKIFDWYKVDFGGGNSKLIEYINKYSDVKVNENATVTFKEYNWELNN